MQPAHHVYLFGCIHVCLFGVTGVPALTLLKVLAWNPRPIAWPQGCSDVISAPRHRRVGFQSSLIDVLHCLCSFIAISGTYFSLQHLSLSDAMVLKFFVPFLTGISGAIFLKEPYTVKEILAGCTIL